MENKLKSDNYIKLPNSIYDNLNITNEELTILILLYRNYMQYKSISLSSIKLLADYMYFDTHNNRKIISDIKNNIKSLLEKKYITNLYNIHYNPITIDNIKDKNTLFYADIIDPQKMNGLLYMMKRLIKYLNL